MMCYMCYMCNIAFSNRTENACFDGIEKSLGCSDNIVLLLFNVQLNSLLKVLFNFPSRYFSNAVTFYFYVSKYLSHYLYFYFQYRSVVFHWPTTLFIGYIAL